MAAPITGQIDTDAYLANEEIVDMSEKIHRAQPDRLQFTTMLMDLAQKTCHRNVINWLEESYTVRTSSLAASATSADTAFTVTTGDGNTVFQINDVVRVMETGEALLVTTVGANAFTATRSWGGTAAASATSVAKLMIVGSAYAQGASSGVNRYTKRVLGTNYVQEIRDNVFFSYIAEGTDLYGGGEPEKELVRKGIEHKQKIESTLFFGAKDYDSSASRGSCGGAYEFISTHVSAAGGALTPAEMDTFLAGPLANAVDPVIFVGPTPAMVLSQMYRGIWTPNPGGTQKFGVKVDAWIDSAFGTSIPVITKREWSDLNATGSNFGTFLWLIDMDAVRLRPFKGFPIAGLRRNIQEPSATANVHEFYSPLSLEFGQEARHGLLTGITSYSAS